MENSLLTGKKKNFGLYEAALATILFIVFTNVFSFFWGMVPREFRKAPYAAYFIAQFVIEMLFAVAAYVVAVSRKIDIVKGMGADRKINGNIVFYGVLISFASLVFFGRLTDCFVKFLELCGYSSIFDPLEIDNFGIYLVYIVTSCVAPALFEEMLFRGTIASGLKERGFKVALIASAVIFTFMHGNAEQTVHQFIIGFIIGYIFLKSGNLWIGVIIHFVNNFTAVTLGYIASGSSESATEVVQETAKFGWTDLISSLAIAVIFAAVGYMVVKWLIQKVLHEDKVANEAANTAETNSTIVVDGVEVKAQMIVEGETQTEETLQENSVNVDVKKEKEPIPFSVTLMFVLAGAYFAFEWLVSLLTGLGL